MTDGFDQALINLGLDLLRADASLTVYDGKTPPDVKPPFVVVYTTIDRPPMDLDLSLDHLSRVWVIRWYCHSVGSGQDASAARAVAQRVRTRLLDVRPALGGFSLGMIDQFSTDPPRRDESTGSLYMDAVSVYELRAYQSA